MKKLILTTFALFLLIYGICINSTTNYTLRNLTFAGTLSPDSTDVDSADMDLDDTLSILNDGLDTIFLTGTDTTIEVAKLNSGGNLTKNDFGSQTLLIDPPPFDERIGITPTDLTPKVVNPKLYGINVSGMFEPSTLPYNEDYTDEQWNWISDLRPEVLRFPSGEYGEFAMLLKNRDGTPSKGYGYDIVEIYNVYDRMFAGRQLKSLSEILAATDLDLEAWIGENNVGKFKDFRNKYITQQTETGRYIDNFIQLIKKIETENAVVGVEYKVKVVLCLNITTETATACKEIVQYLQSNPIWPCEVYGVEMGNEWGDDFHCRSMGINDCNQYYDYLLGTNNAALDDLFTNYSFPAAVYNDHDFLPTFKTDPAFNVKVGLVAAPHSNVTGLVFENDPPLGAGGSCVTVTNEEWNAQLAAKFSQKFMPINRKTFDAVILHPYYTVENFSNIPTSELATTYYPCGTPWNFLSFDSRLEGAFNGIVTEGIKKNYKNFMMVRYLEAYNQFKTELGFGLALTHSPKELWTTEHNIKDENKDPGATPYEKLLPATYTNTFMQATLIQEWYLKNLKLNFQPGYRQNFFTISTFQNYAGGALKEMLSPADVVEINNLGEAYFDGLDLDITDFVGSGSTNFYVKRTSYFAMELLSEINKNSLQYLPSNMVMNKDNQNQPPTVFINPGKTLLYIYYTNVKSVPQTFVLNLDNLISLYPGMPIIVNAGLATLKRLQAAQPYSTAGKAAIYDLNLCYPATPHDVELTDLQPITTNVPSDCPAGTIGENRCLTAPANSMGYFVIPISPGYSPKLSNSTNRANITINPNPSDNIYNINTNELIENLILYNISGVAILEINAPSITSFTLLQYPAGVYFVKLNNNQVIQIVKQ